MEDLHLVGVTEDGAFLVLSTAAGARLRLPLDDRLLRAVRGDRRLGQLHIELDSHLRPAEIQARIRAGASAQEVALAAGVPVDRVRRYEGPVLAEREHVATQAQRTPARRRGDGFVPLLGDLVDERLTARGATGEALLWDSYRREDGQWEVTVTVDAEDLPDHGSAVRAAWVFDPRRRILSPDNDDARWLTDETPAREPRHERRPSPGPRRLASVPSAHADELPIAFESAPTGTAPGPIVEKSAPGVSLVEERPVGISDLDEGQVAEMSRLPDDAAGTRGTAREISARADESRSSTATSAGDPAENGDGQAATATGSAAPEAAGSLAAEDPGLPSSAAGGAEPNDATSEPSSDSAAAPTGPTATKTGIGAQPARHAQRRTSGKQKGRRSAVPAWDDIVFGTRSPE